mmetsp:Transcript_62851/g.142028  ORF Transcript_62851/g.142028 Transcript_62851/m.142028 type:complete len:559 (-) Transcript_62851:19-1695(-)
MPRRWVGKHLGRVIIHVHDLKLVVVDLDALARHQVCWLKQRPCQLVHVHALLEELASDNAQIALRRLVDGHCVIRQVEADDEHPVHILRLGVHEPGLEPQDLPVVHIQLVEVLPWRLRDQVCHRGHGVVPGAVARVVGRFRARHGPLRQLNLDLGVQLDADLLAEVGAREIVSIVDEEVVVPQQRDVHAHGEVVTMDELGLFPRLGLRAIDLVFADGHPGFSEEDREVVPAAVQRVHFPDLHLVVRQEEKDGEGPPLELRRGDVVHDAEESHHLLVVLEELLHVRVDVPATEHHLAIQLLVRPGLSCAGGLHGLPRLHERILLDRHWRTLLPAGLVEVTAGEVITVCELDGFAVNVQHLPHLQILGRDVAASLRWETVASDQLPLGDTAVVLSGLNDLAGVVLEIVVNHHLTHSVVLEVGLDHGLLEETVESQHMPVEGVPSGQLRVCRLRRIGLEDGTCGAIGQGSCPPGLLRLHSLDKLWLVMAEAGLGLYALAIPDVPGLRPGVVLLVLREGEAGQVRQVLQVRGRHGAAGKRWRQSLATEEADGCRSAQTAAAL